MGRWTDPERDPKRVRLHVEADVNDVEQADNLAAVVRVARSLLAGQRVNVKVEGRR